MSFARKLSTRSRIAAPVALAITALGGTAGAATQDEARNRDDAGGSFPSLLSLAPDLADQVEGGQIALFADIAAQLAAAGLTPPDSIEDDEAMSLWIDAMYPLGISGPFSTHALQLDRALLGFDVTDLDQTMEIGEPPDIVTVLRGRFHPLAVTTAWKTNGYELLDVDGFTVASLFEDAEIDLNNEISRLVLSRMNNAALVTGDTLVYTATLPMMKSVISVIAGTTESLAEREDVAALLAALPEPLASALILDGAIATLQAMTPPDLAVDPAGMAALEAQLAATGTIPPILKLVAGITPGGPTMSANAGDSPLKSMPAATMVIRLLFAETADAELAAPVVDARLRSLATAASGEPYSAVFASWEIAALPGAPVLAIDLTLADGKSAAIWLQLVYRRDLLFIAW